MHCVVTVHRPGPFVLDYGSCEVWWSGFGAYNVGGGGGGSKVRDGRKWAVVGAGLRISHWPISLLHKGGTLPLPPRSLALVTDTGSKAPLGRRARLVWGEAGGTDRRTRVPRHAHAWTLLDGTSHTRLHVDTENHGHVACMEFMEARTLPHTHTHRHKILRRKPPLPLTHTNTHKQTYMYA